MLSDLIEEPFEIFGCRACIDQLLPWIALAFELMTDLDHLGGNDAEARLEFLLTRVGRLTDDKRDGINSCSTALNSHALDRVLPAVRHCSPMCCVLSRKIPPDV